MKVFSIIAKSSVIPNFKGEWKERTVGQFFRGCYHTECTYHPDNNESLEDIAYAWQAKTGQLPSEWVKENNVYNQTGDKTYHIAGSYYMPLNLIKASLEIDREREAYYGTEEHSVVELARVAEQLGDMEAVKQYEDDLIKIARKKMIAAECVATKGLLNNYKEGLGEKAYGHSY